MGEMAMRFGEVFAGGQHQAVRLRIDGPLAKTSQRRPPPRRVFRLAQGVGHLAERTEQGCHAIVVVVAVGPQPGAKRVIVDFGGGAKRQCQHAVGVGRQQVEQTLPNLGAPRIRPIARNASSIV